MSDSLDAIHDSFSEWRADAIDPSVWQAWKAGWKAARASAPAPAPAQQMSRRDWYICAVIAGGQEERYDHIIQRADEFMACADRTEPKP